MARRLPPKGCTVTVQAKDASLLQFTATLVNLSFSTRRARDRVRLAHPSDHEIPGLNAAVGAGLQSFPERLVTNDEVAGVRWPAGSRLHYITVRATNSDQ
jgi:hypothetical protein